MFSWRVLILFVLVLSLSMYLKVIVNNNRLPSFCNLDPVKRMSKCYVSSIESKAFSCCSNSVLSVHTGHALISKKLELVGIRNHFQMWISYWL